MSNNQKQALMSAHRSLVKKGHYYWANSVLHFLNGSRSEFHWAVMALSFSNVKNTNSLV